MPSPHRPSVAVRRALRKLGLDIRDARRRRRLPAEVIAERAFTSRPTLQRIEHGDHAVSIGIYAAVLQALGLLDGLGRLPSRAGTKPASQSPPRICRSGCGCRGPGRQAMAADIEVHIDFAPGLKRVGTLHRHARRGGETTSFEYPPTGSATRSGSRSSRRSTLEPRRVRSAGGAAIFGSIGDSAPDTWGRRLMQRAERRLAEREGRRRGR